MSASPEQELISVVLPVHNEEHSITVLYERLTSMSKSSPFEFEFIFVDDMSRDGSWPMLVGLSRSDPRVKLLKLSRNFGHQIAITAGIDHATGHAVVVMDADLQDPPEIIPRLIAQWKAGFEVVYAIREKRKGESFFKRTTAALFYRFIRKVTGFDFPLDAGDFRLMGRRSVDALKTMREKHRYIRGMVVWIGFPQTGVRYERDPRFGGVTKYTFRKMVRFAIDGVTSFSVLPLKMATWLGISAGGVGLCLMVWTIYVRLTDPNSLPGWASIMTVVIFLGGIQLLMLGVIGDYIGRVYDEVRRRPLYVLEEAPRLASFSSAAEVSPATVPNQA